jgi:hypothetical protein
LTTVNHWRTIRGMTNAEYAAALRERLEKALRLKPDCQALQECSKTNDEADEYVNVHVCPIHGYCDYKILIAKESK